MEREKEIDKIKDMRISQLVMDLICTSDDCDKPESCTICKAERLDDLGYRKIPEGAVVLTKEELAEERKRAVEHEKSLMGEDKEYQEYKKILADAESARNAAFYRLGQKRHDEIRKETAREVYIDYEKEIQATYGAYDRIDALSVLLWLKEVCNKHGADFDDGVEVEE